MGQNKGKILWNSKGRRV